MNSDPEMRFLSAAGLCRKAGALVPGVSASIDAIRKKTVRTVYMSSDISDRSAKQLTDKAGYYGVTALRVPIGSDRIGKAIGMRECVAFAVSDKGPAGNLEEAAHELEEHRENQ